MQGESGGVFITEEMEEENKLTATEGQNTAPKQTQINYIKSTVWLTHDDSFALQQ